MSEGTAREIVARAIEGVLLSGGAPRCRELAEMAAKHVVEDLTSAGALAPAGTVAVDRSLIDRLAFDLDKGNTRSAFGHARYLVDRARSKTAPSAAAPAGLTSDSFTERDLDTIGLAVWVTSTAMTERRFVGLDLIEKLHACGFDIVRVAPAADAATGEPS